VSGAKNGCGGAVSEAAAHQEERESREQTLCHQRPPAVVIFVYVQVPSIVDERGTTVHEEKAGAGAEGRAVREANRCRIGEDEAK
jgi:hypothetical protein